MLVKLKNVADVIISNVDKKIKENEKKVYLCNFTDVYNNYAITKKGNINFMMASASKSQIDKFSIKKGYLAITKDSETRDDIGVGTFFADNFENLLLGYHCALIKPNVSLVNSKFLNAYIQSPFVRKYFELNASGSGQRYTLTNDTIANTPIYLPVYDVQLKIGNLLSGIDRQIERNNAIVKRLQVLAQTIFNKFYQNKMLNFNGTLNNLCSLPSGYNFKPDSYILNGKYDLITIKNVNGIFVDYQKTNKINELPDNLKSYCKLNIGDILISLTGNVGRISINTASNGLLNQRVSIILCKNKDYKLYIYLLLNNPYYQLKITQMANGTSQKNLSPLDIEKLKIYIPYNIKEFNNVTKGILDQMCKINLQTTKLIAIKNKILPLLINNQLK